MRICLVSQEITGVRGGGIGTYVGEAGKALAAAGHEVWLVTPEPPDASRRAALAGHTAFHRVLTIPPAGTGIHPRFRPDDPARGYALAVHRTLIGAGVAFDYVEFPDYLAEGAAAIQAHTLTGCYGDAVLSVVLHSPTHDILEWNRQLHLADAAQRATSLLEDAAIRRAPALVAPSPRLLEMTVGRLGLPAGTGTVIRYPMTLGASPPPPAPRAKLSDLRFLFVGRIEPRKGVDRLVEAFAALPDLTLELVGRDEAYSPIATSYRDWLAADMPPNVRCLGPLPRAALLDKLSTVDVVILPSPWENWPNACIEAMAAGRVVVGGRHGGMGEMIEDGVSGFLVDGCDASDIARVIREGVGGALDRLDAIGTAAAERIRALSAPATYVEAIESLVADGHGRVSIPEVDALPLTVVVDAAHDLESAHRTANAALACPAVAEVLVLTHAPVASDIDPRIRHVAPHRSHTAHPRSAAFAGARGDAVLAVPAGAILDVAVLDRAATALAAHPGIDGLRTLARGPDGHLRTAPPSDAGLALVRGSCPAAPLLVRTTALRKLALDP
ncbi:MAG: glycosyltransferase family 4 protein, partial [Planctomycetota bacterium]